MSVICRKAEWSDLPALLNVEYKTMPTNCYLAAVSEKFYDKSQGVLFAAEVDGVIAGVSHIAFLSDGGSWFEVLRVMPEYQKHGCGTKMWEAAFEAAKEHGCTSIRMYTGYTNKVSRGLAERFGLTLTCQTREGVLLSENAGEECSDGFVRVTDPARAAELAKPYISSYNGYFCRNRTFYEMGPVLWEDLCSQGTLWEKDGSIIDVGARQQLDKGFQIGLVGGDVKACIAHAAKLMKDCGLPRLTAMIASSDEKLKKDLEDCGFVFPEAQIIMLEKKF